MEEEYKKSIADFKTDYYKTKEKVIDIAKEVDFLAREQAVQKKEHDMFKKEIKEEIKEEIQKSQKTTVLEIKEIIATEFKDNAKWKDRVLITLGTSIFMLFLSVLVGSF